ncbi:Linalool synthase [Quillaja saponaria]|uniref:Linalool synthase n=1 Tax=Quillaja saponaria TaxID=32244 RepID=A0AAD7M262_QUISA|nr:Linalool synthase [Quillaja saponaria]
MDGLVLVDNIQRLGMEYYFEEEIEAALQRQFLMFNTQSSIDPSEHELYKVALRFRLLRQGGHCVHASVFNNLKDKKGKIRGTFCEDIKGLIGLYETSHLSIECEDNLDEVGELSRLHLNDWLSRHHDFHSRARVVESTLRHPFHKNLPRFMPRSFYSNNYQKGWISTALQELANMDSNIVKSIHLKEILRFPDELTLLTDAVNRWDLQAAEQLPDYMEICFKALYDITNEFACKVYRKHGWNPIDTLRKSWAKLLNAFLVEAQWLVSGPLPKADEYLKNGIITAGVHVALVHTFFMLGEGIYKETVSLMDDIPGIISSTSTILRLSDDLESAKAEKQDGLDGSYLDCYMKEHQGVSTEDANDHVTHMISTAWKQLNQQCLTSNSFPSSFTKACLNAARMVPLMYSYDKNSLSGLEEHVRSLLLQ